MAGVTRFFFPTFRPANVAMRLAHPEWGYGTFGRSYPHKSFRCNTYGSPRKCCKQKTYGRDNSFSCNTYKKVGGVHPSSQKPISLPKLFSSAPYLVTSLLPYFARRSRRGRMLGQRAKREGQLTRDERRLSDYFDEVASGALLRKQGEDGLIHRGELALLVHGKPEQVGIGDLLMPHQPAGKRLGGRHKTDFVF